MLARLRQSLLTWLFLKTGARLFEVVVFDGADDDPVCAIHFAKSEFHLRQSMLSFLQHAGDDRTE